MRHASSRMTVVSRYHHQRHGLSITAPPPAWAQKGIRAFVGMARRPWHGPFDRTAGHALLERSCHVTDAANYTVQAAQPSAFSLERAP